MMILTKNTIFYQPLFGKALKLIVFFILVFHSTSLFAQSPENYDEDGNLILKNRKGFATGLYLGSYFPNSYSATLYDGYGFDFDGNKNTYENSWMYEKIINQYGGGYGQPDYIGEALGVPPEDWNFDESDMPANMRYKTAFLIGFTGRYSVDAKNAVLINVNAAILKAVGNFTITTRPLPGSTQVNNSIKQFNISGEEQRLHFQAGYQHLFGKGETFNVFMEGGLHATLAKFDKNEIEIENLRINLFEPYYDQNGGTTFFPGAKPVSLGFGAFAGLGVNIRTTGKWMLQLLYNVTLENIKITYDPKLTLNNALGLRAYYSLSKQ
ncbi:MAG: hypothetical protein IPP71_05630 [Bacteroidetes bacterium]|nr:hypothetical protein [Bacteroidota bacterium]